ncbi:hypothetical protein E2562_000756 [Oryza meyeriana var. granulata]|uniref:Uncharacterized protein n=1 Tax=Oryza meyeriana var. granulata TaxID=110450 RepID=A0A6G1DUG3_9ORYZ|nr:hypothetical protein E2562_000756 [Oryza meyeriana var. granulata]
MATALEKDKAQWQRELEQAEQGVKRLSDSLMATKDLESKVAAASEQLVGLRAELFARAVEGTIGEEAATELEKPTKAELTALRRREGISATSILSLEEELSRVTTVLTAAQDARAKDGGVETKMPAQLDEARREAEQAKAKAQSAQEEVSKAREEAVLAKAAVHAMEARLEAVTLERLAATTSEGIAAASAARAAAGG